MLTSKQIYTPLPPTHTAQMSLASLEKRVAELEAKAAQQQKTLSWLRYRVVEVLKHLGMYEEREAAVAE